MKINAFRVHLVDFSDVLVLLVASDATTELGLLLAPVFARVVHRALGIAQHFLTGISCVAEENEI